MTFEDIEATCTCHKSKLRAVSPGPSVDSTAASEAWSDDEVELLPAHPVDEPKAGAWEQVSKRTALALRRYIEEDADDDLADEWAAQRIAEAARRLALPASEADAQRLPRAGLRRSKEAWKQVSRRIGNALRLIADEPDSEEEWP